MLFVCFWYYGDKLSDIYYSLMGDYSDCSQSSSRNKWKRENETTAAAVMF